ncbi:hypothetical protein [Flavobacterium silvaticum]|uniref:Uncharacterized protein n=1 Tax=Flavobacterium silvaticum TaxID=1852020 RepID=A0A972FQ10_9FLAO|nr:hypothetical protein [Flavobacterium silvaticum]NMH29260.1 hypothetical protein [Flavobacterium silvaticum]
MKRNQKNAGIAFFWIWTFVFFGITITEMLEMNPKILGAHKILMTDLTAFLFIIYLGIAVNLFFNLKPRKFRIAESVFFIGGIGLFIGFFMTLNHYMTPVSLH